MMANNKGLFNLVWKMSSWQNSLVTLCYLLFFPCFLFYVKMHLENPEQFFDLSYFFCQITFPYLFIVAPLSFMQYTQDYPFSQIFLQAQAQKMIRAILCWIILADILLLSVSLSLLYSFKLLLFDICLHILFISFFYFLIAFYICALTQHTEYAYLLLLAYTVMNVVYPISQIRFPFYRLFPNSHIDYLAYISFGAFVLLLFGIKRLVVK